MNWKKYLTLFSAAVITLLVAQQIIKACADYDYYDTYPQFFGNQISDQPAYYPFNFVPGDLFYDDYRWTENNQYTIRDSVNKAFILSEWQAHIGASVPAADIDSLLYASDVSTMERLQKGVNKLPQNKFAQYLLKKKNKHVLDYLVYAKKCEIAALKNVEDWNHESISSESDAYNVLKDEGLRLIKKEKDGFLKMKYAFQVLRMSFYNENYQEVLNLYDELIGKKQDSSVAFTRNIGFRAGAYFSLGDKARAAFYYSKMFANSNAYIFSAVQSFEWAAKKADLKDILSYCQNDKERASVLIVKALREYGYALDLIKKAYELDPKTKGLEVLINREVNKIEDKYFAQKVYNMNQISFSSSSYYWWYPDATYNTEVSGEDSLSVSNIQKLYSFTDRLIQDNVNGRPTVWYLVQAYLSCIQDQPVKMKEKLSAAKNEGLNQNETTVYKVIDLLYTLYKNDKITPETEAELLPKLKNLSENDSYLDLGALQFRDIMSQILAGKYFRQGDTIKGVYAMAHAVSWSYEPSSKYYSSYDFQDRQGDVLNQMSIGDLKKVIAFREDKSKSAFDNWLVQDTYYTPDVLKDLLGVKYIREQKFHDADEVFATVSRENEVQFPSPFRPHINDYQTHDYRDSINTYSRYSYSKRMEELKSIIEKNPNDVGALYGYALALYNTSYYGKAGNIVQYSRSYTDPGGYFKSKNDDQLSDYLKEYYRVYDAEKYFVKAAEAAKKAGDSEIRAQALWGAAKCWQKRSPLAENENDWQYSSGNYDGYYAYSLKNPYFKTLFSQLSSTDFMKEVLATCDYYEDFTMEQ